MQNSGFPTERAAADMLLRLFWLHGCPKETIRCDSELALAHDDLAAALARLAPGVSDEVLQSLALRMLSALPPDCGGEIHLPYVSVATGNAVRIFFALPALNCMERESCPRSIAAGPHCSTRIIED